MKSFLALTRKDIKNWFLGLIALCLSATLLGCPLPLMIAAAPVLTGAAAVSTGFVAYKTIQTSTGGSIGINFKDAELSIEDQKALASLKRLAIYPGDPINVELAEILSKSDRCDIVAPYSVKKALPETVKFGDFKQMIKREQIQHALKVCQAVKADGLLIYSVTGRGTDMKIWSLKRAEATVNFKLEVFSQEHRNTIWNQEGEIVCKIGGGKVPPQDEVNKIVASAVAEKFLSDVGRR
jgi:hypothetical protein